MKMAVLGCGNMAQALVVPMKKADDTLAVSTYTPSKTRAIELAEKVGGDVLRDIGEMSSFDLVFLGLKPQQLQSLACDIGPLHKGQTVVSILAGVSLSVLKKTFHTSSIIRLMPNLPFLIGHGVVLVSSSKSVISKHETSLLTILRAVSKVFTVSKEEDIDNITPVSGSGPAFLFEWANFMKNYLENRGIHPIVGRDIIVHTLLGSAKLMEHSSHSFEHLRNIVTSKKGVTHEALEEFRKSGLEDMIYRALEKARKRAVSLSSTAEKTPSFFEDS